VVLRSLHVLIEGEEEAQKARHGELAKVAAQHPGDIGLADAEQAAASKRARMYCLRALDRRTSFH
jgi:hypothetical protein